MNRKGLLQSGAFLVWVFVLAVAAPAQQEDAYRGLRAGLIEEIRADVKLTSERIGRARLTDRVLQAMLKVTRHEFVPDRLRPYAYENRPLPIGFGQTISQPYIVAVMTDLMDASEDATVLEVGTGSGYQAAVLAECVKQVYSIEIIEELGREAASRLERLGYRNVEVRTGDGYYGWKEKAPFDAIMVTAAASHIPPPLIEQLKPGGRMIIPIGSAFMTQHLMLVEKDPGSKIKTRQLLPVAFVPLTGGH